MHLIPQTVFLTRGVGTHRHQLTAFEYALRDADVELTRIDGTWKVVRVGLRQR